MGPGGFRTFPGILGRCEPTTPGLALFQLPRSGWVAAGLLVRE